MLSLIKKYRIELEDSKKAISSAINTIEYNTIGLNRKVSDDKDMLEFIEKSLVTCNAYAPKKTKEQKSKAKINHSGHNH